MSNTSGSCGFEALSTFLKESSIAYKRNFHLKYETYFKKGGVAAFYIMPSDGDELACLVRFLKGHGIAWKLVGLTSNVMFLDELNYGVIITARNMTRLVVSGGRFEVDCGYPLQDFVRSALVHGKGGLEGLEGVPGSLGGAIFMNAGAYGYNISDYLVSVVAISPSGQLIRLEKKECGFENRSSIFKISPEYIIVSAEFELKDIDRKHSARLIEIFHIARHSYQEFAYPNLGSMFSVRGDFYKEFFNGSVFYFLTCILFKLVLKNPVTKFLFRKRPNNKYLNWLANAYLAREASSYTPSVKSMNILINDGVATTEDILKYISVVRSRLYADTKIENELVVSPVDLSSDCANDLVSNIIKKGF